MMDGQQDPATIIKENGWKLEQNSNFLNEICCRVIQDHPEMIEKIKKKPWQVRFLVGQVMKITKGSADPVIVSDMLKEKLNL